MIDFDTARTQLMVQARTLAATQRRSLLQAAGCVLAENIVSAIDVPPADNSAVDGYAVRVADLQTADKGMPVSQRIAAGEAAGALQAGTAARIFTGAPVPAGADLVVMQEDCQRDGETVTVSPGQRSAGDNIRARGQDVGAGDTVLAAGTKLLPWHLGLLASVGIAEVNVYQPLRVAVLSTGDELQEPGEAPVPGKIFNSNRYQLLSLLQACGFEAVDGGCVADTAAATEAALQRMAAQADIVVTTGGVSVGEEDHVRAAVEKLGELALWRIAIKPGKPFAFGNIGTTLFAGLPGNPSAVLVTFLVLLKPFLDLCQGRAARDLIPQRLPVAFSVSRAGKRQEYLRVRVQQGETGPTLEKHPNQSSGMLSSACWADGLAVVPVGKVVSPGDVLDYFSFAQLLG